MFPSIRLSIDSSGKDGGLAWKHDLKQMDLWAAAHVPSELGQMQKKSSMGVCCE